MRKRLLFMGIGSVFAVAGLFAEVRKIPVDEAVKMAIESNLSLESARISLDTKKRKNDLKWNEFIPALGVTGSLVRDNEAAAVSGVAPVPLGGGGVYGVVPYSVDAPQWHIAGNLSASITIVTALFEGLKNYRLDYEAGVLSYEKAKAQMERDLRKLYHNILLAEENLRLQREKYAAAERQETQAQANYRAGLAPELQYLQAQVAKENLKPQIDEAENNVRLVKANFAFTIGLPYDTEIELVPLAGEFTPVPLEVARLIADASRNKPDILELRQTLLVAQSGRKAQALQARTPYLDLRWNMQRAFTGDPWKDSWGDGGLWSKSGSFTITLGMTFNGLVPWFKESQALKDTDNQIAGLNVNLAQLIRGTEIEVYNTCLTLAKTEASVEAMRRNVELAERSYQSTETAYRNGLQTLLEVQNAANQLQEARLGVMSQRVSYLNGLIDLEYTLGVPFGTLSRGEEE
ncbi:MAG: TolC family protein [Spirochaetaceae bacterium]|nr:TolC family protein [Spirochaetaceae bacterium]